MKKQVFKLLLLTLVCIAQYGYAQELYMPRNIKQAYTNGTRSMDGKPGKNYWQNHGKYAIQLTVK
ncbi:MAG: M1 family peptidase, partial [Flavobacterium sp.]